VRGPLLALATLFAVSPAGCASAPAIGRGGRVYEVMVRSIDGRRTSVRGAEGHACTIQVGDAVRQVWLANERRDADEVPLVPLLRADEAALMDGVTVEYVSWPWTTFHRVTAEDLAAEAVLVQVPGPTGPHDVELWFRETRDVAQLDPPKRAR
jgi:hypothetical protein